MDGDPISDDSLPSATCRKDMGLRVCACNAAFARLAGVGAPEGAVGRTDEVLWPAETAAALAAGDRAALALAEGDPAPQEVRIGERTFLWARRVLRGPGGEGIGLASVATDVTEYARARSELTAARQGSDAILRLSQRLELADSYDDVLAATRDSVEAVLGYHTVWVYLMLPGDSARLLAIQGAMQPVTSQLLPTLDMHSDPFLEEILLGDHVVEVLDARTDPRTNKAIVEALGNRTIVNVPMRLVDRHLGALGTGSFGDEGVRPPGRAGTAFLAAVASHVALALDRLHAYGERRKLTLAIEQAPTAIAIVDLAGVVEYANPRYRDLAALDEPVGRPVRVLLSGGNEDEVWSLARGGEPWQGEEARILADGDLVWERVTLAPLNGPDGRPQHLLLVRDDVTLRKRFEEELLRKASYDDLTGLPNRILAADRASQAIEEARREQARVALLIVDLDNFCRVNETLGHEVGDEVLRAAGARLAGAVRHASTTARLAADEFCVLLPGLARATDAEQVARRVLAAFREPFELGGRPVYCPVSVGIAVFPDDGDDVHTLLRDADAAVHRAKQLGGDQVRFFTTELNDRVRRFVDLETQLRHALERDELRVVHQPLVSGRDGRVLGVEALLRWTSAVLGVIPPDQFIPVAEDTGLIRAIGAWVLHRACADVAALRATVSPGLQLAVNVSSRQFASGDFVAEVERALAVHRLPADALEIEITERLLMSDRPEGLDQLRALVDLGVRLSIDDFGTGWSALSYLRRFPVSTLKIDRSFVADLETDRGDALLVEAIVAMAHGLRLEVVAEGVETPAQRAFLERLGVDRLQGFHFARPMSAAALGELLSCSSPRVQPWTRGASSGL